ncbi:SIR2 family protein [Shewanella aegiceratis]|uniref:SIR2 family protein n=1 Tax=Shewanella aegiceratis TaxID=2864203 RepID=UPI001C658E10|nr:SIR2 family protein [Shewanella aegiceratis]QYJ84084.1 SIR2 family protein [Shewanella aegiceratis]
MEIKRFDSLEVIQLLSNAFSNNSIVPIVGAGFTNGCRLRNGNAVPGGQKFKSLMLNEIKLKVDDESYIKISSEKFSKIANFFFDENFVSSAKSKSILKQNFHGVILDESRRRFVNDIDWKYIYTLNIDDAIESCSKFNVILPFGPVNEESKNNRSLFKIHGDINYEICHDDSKLIFSSPQYFKSLDANKYVLSVIKSDFNNKTIVYIGCSLDDEIELSFISSNTEVNNENHNIFFTCDELDIVRKQDLKSQGISYVITYDQGKHHQVYDTIYKAYAKSLDEHPEFSEFKQLPIKLEPDADKNEIFLIKGITEIQDRSDNRVIPYYYGERTIEDDIVNDIKGNALVVIEGGSFSGKTQLMYSLANKLLDKEVFFIDSKYFLDKFVAIKLLKRENAVIFFDSGSIDEDIGSNIKKEIQGLSDRGTTIVVALDKNNNRIFDILCPSIINDVPHHFLSSKLGECEVDNINTLAYEVKVPKFNKGQTLLQNIYNSFEVFGGNVIVDNVELSSDFFCFLYVIGIQDSAATGESFYQAGLNVESLKALIDRYHPFVELEKVSIYEAEEHSGFKVVCNSKAWLYSILRRYYIEKTDFCVKTITDVLLRFKGNNTSLFIKGLLFDTINELFSGDRRQGAGHGAGNLILKLYDKLEKLVSNEPEFHVQRSKAYYNIYSDRDDVERLDDIIRNLKFSSTYATAESTERNIRNQLALINLKKCYLLGSLSSEIVRDTIRSCYNCIKDEAVNSRYVIELLSGTSKGSGYLESLIQIIDSSPSLKLLLLEFKEEYDFIMLRKGDIQRAERMKNR